MRSVMSVPLGMALSRGSRRRHRSIRAFLSFDEVFEVLEAVEPHRLEVIGERSERRLVGGVEAMAAAFGHGDNTGLT
jgi:hypothetical protein